MKDNNHLTMQTESSGLGEFYARMIYDHASINDNEFVGQIILYALGIRAACTGFTVDRDGIYHLYWCYYEDNGIDEFSHHYTKEDIVNALMKVSVDTKISVTRRED